MPGSIDGLKLAHAVRNRWPPIKIIIVSGHVNYRKKTCRLIRDFSNHVVPKNCYPNWFRWSLDTALRSRSRPHQAPPRAIILCAVPYRSQRW